MNLISRILKRNPSEKEPELQFGRFNDGYKSEEQMAFWDQAVVLFAREKYLESFEALLRYLHEPDLENVFWTQANGKLTFTLYQGSKVIKGEVSAIHCFVYSVIAKYEKPDVQWMRLLLEENYNMTYSRYAVNASNEILIVFDNYMEEALPQKMYEALRELSVRADKIDDLLLFDFDKLKSTEIDHIKHHDQHIKDVKYRFLKEKTEAVRKNIEHPSHQFLTYKGSYIFMILACCYSLDYLIKPEGSLMKCIENCHRSYFNEQAEEPEIKTSTLIRLFNDFFNQSEEDIKAELYDARSTFGLDLPVGAQGLLEVIDAQWNDLIWFFENDFADVHRFVSDYVVGFSLFSMSLPIGYKKLLHVYYQVTEPQYFTDLGFSKVFVKDQKIVKQTVLKELQAIKTQYADEEYPLHLDLSLLEFDNISLFIHRYLLMLRQSLAGS